MEITKYSHASFPAWPRERVKLWLQMIDTLIIRFWRFDWISAVSRKVLTFLESELQHFDVWRFLWQLSTTSQVKQDPFTHKLVSSALQNNVLQGHLKSPVWTHRSIIIFSVAHTSCCLTTWWTSPLTGASREPCQSLVNFIFVLHMYLTRYSKCSIIFCTITLNKNKPNEYTCEKHRSQLSVCRLNQTQRVKKLFFTTTVQWQK